MTKNISNKTFEKIIYFIIWLMVFSMPLLNLRNEGDLNWSRIYIEWLRVLPFLLVFVINNSFLAPKFLLKNLNIQYLIYTTIIIFIITYFSDFTNILQHYLQQQPPQIYLKPPFMSPGNSNFPPPQDVMHEGQGFLANRIIDRIIFAFLVVGFNSAIKFAFKRQEDEKQIEQQNKIHLQTELSFLKNQISPHFFMNTLNNIHSLITYDTEIAQESVISLSKLMRHVLYESQSDKISLRKELDFIQNYIDLMKLRNSNKVLITLDMPTDLPNKMIPPLLFTSYVENAFKHGISYNKDSYINISFQLSDNRLLFQCKNSNHADTKENDKSGIGVENSRKRLELIYGNDYILETENTVDEFSINLSIPIQNYDTMYSPRR